jgi:hypothetical protein
MSTICLHEVAHIMNTLPTPDRGLQMNAKQLHTTSLISLALQQTFDGFVLVSDPTPSGYLYY